MITQCSYIRVVSRSRRVSERALRNAAPWLLAVSLAGSFQATVRGAELTAADAIAGYRQNYAAFRTLRVTWKRQVIYQPDKIEVFRRSGDWTEEQVAEMSKPLEFHQQFFRDGASFQVRAPAPMGEARELNTKYSFPNVPLTSDSYLTAFKDMVVLTSAGGANSGVQAWSGVRYGHGNGVIYVSFPKGYEEAWLPPLALTRSASGFELHPFDEFFAERPDAIRVVRRDALDGVECYILEKEQESPEMLRQWTTAKEWQPYRDGLSAFTLHRAWVDVSRGCLPLRLELRGYFVYRGTKYDDPWGMGLDYVVETRKSA